MKNEILETETEKKKIEQKMDDGDRSKKGGE